MQGLTREGMLQLPVSQKIKFPFNVTGVSHQSRGLEFATAFCNTVKGPQPCITHSNTRGTNTTNNIAVGASVSD